MFNSFLTILTQNMLKFLEKEGEFFAQNEAGREKKLDHLNAPAPFKVWLKNSNEHAFLSDLSGVIELIQGANVKKTSQNELLKTLLKFFNGPLATRMEIMHESYSMSEENKLSILDKLFKGNNGISETLRELLLTNSYQELANAASELSQTMGNTPYIVVQSPREIDVELKREIREKISEKHPYAFPIFQVNRDLIGGFRVFEGGKVVDHSWISKVSRFTSLASV